MAIEACSFAARAWTAGHTRGWCCVGELPCAAAPWIWPQAERAKDPCANAHLSLGLTRYVHYQKDGGDSIEPDTGKASLRGIRMNWVQDEPLGSFSPRSHKFVRI